MDKEFLDALKKNTVTMTKLAMALDRFSENLDKKSAGFNTPVDRKELPNRFANMPFSRADDQSKFEPVSKERVAELLGKK